MRVSRSVPAILIGVAYVDHRRRTAQFNDDHLRVFELFGHQIAAALENAMTYAQVNEANRLKTEFLNNISHELRTPLTSIMGFTDCLRQQTLPPDAEVQVVLIERSSEVLRKLVERVLTFSALESDSLPVVRQTFSIPGLIARLRSRFAPAAEPKGLELRLLAGERCRRSSAVTEATGRSARTCSTTPSSSPARARWRSTSPARPVTGPG